ncbi:MAG: nucleoside monophosphate kinase [Chloroflexota bacterium]
MGLYILLVGPQGSGKGVQAGFIQKQHGGIPHISTGDLFRAMRNRQDDFAKQIQQTMAEGKLVSDETTCQMVEERLALPDAQQGVIFDGFPRTIPQVNWLDGYLASKGEKLAAVILLELDLYEAFRRTFGRVSTATGESYNIYSHAAAIDWTWVEHSEKAFPPRLEVTAKGGGEKLIRRPDDASADAIIKRLDIYIRDTKVLIPYYEAKGLLHRVDAAQSIQAVSQDIQQIIEKAKGSD